MASRATPPLAHVDHGKVVYEVRFKDEDGRRYSLEFVFDATKAVALLNGMVLGGVTERALGTAPFTARQRLLGDGREKGAR